MYQRTIIPCDHVVMQNFLGVAPYFYLATPNAGSINIEISVCNVQLHWWFNLKSSSFSHFKEGHEPMSIPIHREENIRMPRCQRKKKMDNHFPYPSTIQDKPLFWIKNNTVSFAKIEPDSPETARRQLSNQLQQPIWKHCPIHKQHRCTTRA